MEIKPGRREKMLNNGTRKMWKRKRQVYNKKSETSKNQIRTSHTGRKNDKQGNKKNPTRKIWKGSIKVGKERQQEQDKV